MSFAYPGQPTLWRGLDLAIGTGEICAVVGPSGVGKSTLLKLMAGQITPSAGRVEIAPTGGDSLPILYHPQQAMLLPWLTVSANVSLGLKLAALPPSMPKTEIVSQLSLSSVTDRHPARLSGGQIERTALARTLLLPSQTYLLDEPLAGTDYGLRVKIEDFLTGFVTSRSAALVLVTHDLPQAVAVGGTVLVLSQGSDAVCAERLPAEAALAGLSPSARRANPAFGPCVQRLLDRVSA